MLPYLFYKQSPGFPNQGFVVLKSIRSIPLYNRKKKFFFFYPHTLTIWLKRPVYRGFSGEGKCEGKLNEE